MKRQTGFTLIEVAIAVFILAVGLLGLASLQFMSLRNMDMSQKSDSANDYLQQIAEAMRANAPGIDEFVQEKAAIVSATISCESDCTDSDFAKDEMIRIKNAMIKQFPGGKLSVSKLKVGSYNTTKTVTTDGVSSTTTVANDVFRYTIELEWQEKGSFILRSDTQSTDDPVVQSRSIEVVL